MATQCKESLTAVDGQREHTHLLALQNVTRAICALGVKFQTREFIVAQALEGMLDEGHRGYPLQSLGYIASIHVVPAHAGECHQVYLAMVPAHNLGITPHDIGHVHSKASEASTH